MTVNTIAARLEELLATRPGSEDVAATIEARLLRLVAETWSALVVSCAGVLAGPAAAALREVASALPGTELLLPRLAAMLSPSTLLGLDLKDSGPDRAAMTVMLLSRASPQQRELVLDALQAGPDETSLPGLCATWARRMLVAALGSIDGLSQQDRLALQDRLLAHRRDASGPHDAGRRPGHQEQGAQERGGYERDELEAWGDDLGEALLAASHRRASQILATRAGVPPSVVETAITRRDRLGLLALCRAAGAGPEEAMALQIQLARICPNQTLTPAPSRGPMGTWRIEALRGRTGPAD